jgi:hypothetical protein
LHSGAESYSYITAAKDRLVFILVMAFGHPNRRTDVRSGDGIRQKAVLLRTSRTLQQVKMHQDFH